MSPTAPTVKDAIREHDFARWASLCALRLSLSSHALDREGASVAYDVALQHLRTWQAITGNTKGNA